MKDTIIEKYNCLKEDLYTSYNKVKIVDNFDWTCYSPYTIFYLNKKESFDKFKDLWKGINKEEDNYDDILNGFCEKAKKEFDFIELGTLDIYTDSEYELEI